MFTFKTNKKLQLQQLHTYFNHIILIIPFSLTSILFYYFNFISAVFPTNKAMPMPLYFNKPFTSFLVVLLLDANCQLSYLEIEAFSPQPIRQFPSQQLDRLTSIHMKPIKQLANEELKKSNNENNVFPKEESTTLFARLNDANMDVSSSKSPKSSILKQISNEVKYDIPESLGKVVAAALLITTNTVGASMMVLPGLASGPGLMISSGFMFGELYSEHGVLTLWLEGVLLFYE